MTKVLLVALLFVSSHPSFAADTSKGCWMKITRVPCAGKETEALKPFNGKATTEEKFPAGSEADCIAAAKKENTIRRKGSITKKEIVPMFDGKDVGEKLSTELACQ